MLFSHLGAWESIPVMHISRVWITRSMWTDATGMNSVKNLFTQSNTPPLPGSKFLDETISSFFPPPLDAFEGPRCCPAHYSADLHCTRETFHADFTKNNPGLRWLLKLWAHFLSVSRRSLAQPETTLHVSEAKATTRAFFPSRAITRDH